MPRVFVIVSLLLIGCPAAVTAEAIDGGFGLGLSAAFVRLDNGESQAESIVISTTGGVCESYGELMEAQAEFYEAVVDIMSQNYCSNLEEPFVRYAEAAQDVLVMDARILSLGVVEGDFDQQSYEGNEWWGTVGVVDNVPYVDALEDFDADGDQMDGCGLSEGDVELDAGDSWTLDGDLEITTAETDGPVAGTIEADMLDEDGDEDGELTASFTAVLCEIDL